MSKYLLVSIVCMVLCVSCQTINTYVYNRSIDFSDSFTLGVEKNNFGAGVWIYCFGGGIHLNEYAKGFGIRNGHYGLYKAGGVGEINLSYGGSGTITNQMGNSFLFMNSNQHRPEPTPFFSKRNSYIFQLKNPFSNYQFLL